MIRRRVDAYRDQAEARLNELCLVEAQKRALVRRINRISKWGLVAIYLVMLWGTLRILLPWPGLSITSGAALAVTAFAVCRLAFTLRLRVTEVLGR